MCEQIGARFVAEYRARLEQNLTPRRLHHSLCVAKEAARLAEKYGADPERAFLAGLLHDVCKDFSKELFLQTFRDFDIMLDDIQAAEPKLWHAVAGEAYLRRRLHITDEEILSAVRYHTTAKAGMGLLEKILYVADFTSEDRDYPDVDEMRRRADESLDAALFYGLRYTVADLADRGKPVHPDTLNAYNEAVLRR